MFCSDVLCEGGWWGNVRPCITAGCIRCVPCHLRYVSCRSDDQRATAVTSQRHDLALHELDEILGRFGYDLQAFGLPLPATAASAKQASKELRRELEFDRDFETNRAETMRQMMRQSPEQAGAYDAIVTS